MDDLVVKQRLGLYGAAWLGAFLLVLALSCLAVAGLGMDMASAADLLLAIALPVLGLGVLGVIVLTFLRPVGLGPKLAVLAIGVLLLLPLLWAPVLAVVVAAWLTGAVIEYSTVYAQFRITVSNLLYPVVASVVSGAAIRFVWDLFQVVATVVGTVASAIQVWSFFQKLRRPKALEA